MQTHRRQSLTALVQFDAPIAELQELFRDLPYDYAGEPVTMTKAHVAHALRRFIDGNVTAVDLENWADLVEGRPGIEYQAGYERTLANVLFQLSTPDINQPITVGLCWRLLKEVHEGSD